MIAPEQECEEAHRLRDALAAALQPGSPISPALAGGGRRPIFRFFACGARCLLDRGWPGAAGRRLLVQQVREPAEEARNCAPLPALTVIDDDVWSGPPAIRGGSVSTLGERGARETACYLRLSIVRGKIPAAPFCQFGTGRTSTFLSPVAAPAGIRSPTAQRFADARLLAVDLSLKQPCLRDAQVARARSAQHRICPGRHSAARSIGRTFDVIDFDRRAASSCRSFAGWRVLLSLLRPGGHGDRRSIADRRAGRHRDECVHRRARLWPSIDDIRRCRQDDHGISRDGHAAGATSTKIGDFFSTSDCRDLLLHVQEHGTTIPAIKEFLQANGLEFLGFELDARVLRTYAMRFPEDSGADQSRSLGRVRV